MDPKSRQFVADARDMTASKKVEQTLQESEAFYNTIINYINDGLMVLNRDLQIVFVNEAIKIMRRQAGLPTDIIGKTLMETNPYLPKNAEEEYRRIFVTGDATYGHELFILNNIRVCTEIWKIPVIEDGKVSKVIAVIRDITECRRMEEALQESEAQLRQITDNMLDIILKIDEQGNFRYITPSIKAILGYDPQKLLGKAVFDYVHNDDQSRIRALFKTAINLLSIEKADLRFKHADGHYLWLEVLSKGVVEDGTVKRTIISARDITDRKQAKEELDKYSEHLEELIRERTSELESFAYSVSHDLRAPLRSIHGFSQALLEDYGGCLDRQGKEYLERLKMSSKRMAELIDALLDLSRITRIEMHREQVDLSALARSIVCELRMTQPERQATIIIQEGLTAEGDLLLLRVMLENLLENAWKFTGRKPETRIEFGITNLDGSQVYSVRDNGAGFDMAYAGKLFSPFQRLHSQTEFSGTGIGLATIQRIVLRHCGKIWAEGEVDKGAVFYFTLS